MYLVEEENQKFNLEFGKKIKGLRTGLKMSRKALGEKLDMHETTIKKYEDGLVKGIPRNRVLEFAVALDTTIDYLLEYEGSVKVGGYSDEDRLPINHKKRIPLLGQISAGQPILAIENIERYEMVDEDSVDFALRVKGNSMIGAGILEGSLVYVQQDADVQNGDIVIAMVGDDEATVKRFYKYDGSIVLRPENPLLKEQVYHPRDVKIIGKVKSAKIMF